MMNEMRHVGRENGPRATTAAMSRHAGPDSRSKIFLPPRAVLLCYDLSGRLDIRLASSPNASLLRKRDAHKLPAPEGAGIGSGIIRATKSQFFNGIGANGTTNGSPMVWKAPCLAKS